MPKFVNWKFWLGLLVSALFIWLALGNVEMARLWQSLQSADLFDLSLVTLIYLLQYLIRIWRWRILLEPLKRTGFLNRLLTVLVGFGANCILPAHLGELVRAKYLGNLERVSGSSVLGSIVVERLFDCSMLLLIFVIGLMIAPFPENGRLLFQFLRNAGLLFGLIIVLIIGMAVFKSKAKSLLAVLEKILFFMPEGWRRRLLAISGNFISGLMPLKNAGHWLQAIAYSFLLWSSALFQVYLVEHALGLHLPFQASFIVMALATLGVLVPSSPGYIGTYHYAVQLGFLLFGVGKEEALSAAILLHATFFFPILLLGLVSFLYLQTRLNRNVAVP